MIYELKLNSFTSFDGIALYNLFQQYSSRFKKSKCNYEYIMQYLNISLDRGIDEAVYSTNILTFYDSM